MKRIDNWRKYNERPLIMLTIRMRLNNKGFLSKKAIPYQLLFKTNTFL